MQEDHLGRQFRIGITKKTSPRSGMYFCAACKLYVKDGGVAEHDQSTAHLLSVTKAPTLRKGVCASPSVGLEDIASNAFVVCQYGCPSPIEDTSC